MKEMRFKLGRRVELGEGKTHVYSMEMRNTRRGKREEGEEREGRERKTIAYVCVLCGCTSLDIAGVAHSGLTDLLLCGLDLYLVTWHNVNQEIKHVILGDGQSNIRPL